MTIAAQLKQIQGVLDAWVVTRKGSARIAGDPVDMSRILTIKPGGICAAVMFHGEEKRGDFEESGMVDRRFWVAFTRGRGFKLNSGDELVAESAGGPPMFDLIEEGRQKIRGIQFDPNTTEVTPDYKNTKPLQVDGYLLDAYVIEFTIGVQLPSPDQTEETL